MNVISRTSIDQDAQAAVRVIADECNDLTPTMRWLLNELFGDLMRLEKRIAEVTREIEALAASDEKARRLMTIPGIGPLGPQHSSQPVETVGSLKKPVTWPPGLASFRSNILQDANPRCLASASGETAIFAGF
jgi:hypothetical protein